ncbi:TraB [Gracilaria domingensis]|nr:TraB [Gracilaria domingensis]
MIVRRTLIVLSRQSVNRHRTLQDGGLFTRWKHSYPSRSTAVLESKHATVHLLGTMHIAEASAESTRNLITREYEKGSLGAVFLELDRERFDRIKKEASTPDESLLSHALKIISSRKHPLAGLMELGIGSIYRALHRLGFASGVDFKAAIETAEDLKVPIVLGDQDLRTTMRRLGEGFRSDFDLQRMMAILMTRSKSQAPESPLERKLGEAFQAMASGDPKSGQEKLAELIDRNTVHQLIEPMRMLTPNIARAMLYERDVIMTENLIKASKNLPEKKNVIVGIVGLAHVEGIADEWDLQTEDVEHV